MSCAYYTFRNNDYYCLKKGDYVNSDVYQRYCKNYSYDECPIYKDNPNSGGCYLTSACVEAKGLSDDCEALTVLQDFRDHWLRQQPGGAEEIAEYYATAPRIVAEINKRADAREIWNALYDALVAPCVKLIQAGAMEQARKLYREMSLSLKERYM